MVMTRLFVFFKVIFIKFGIESMEEKLYRLAAIYSIPSALHLPS